ncbi:CPBP family intramembrane glutamic endopeptidase [Bacillus sp. REN16]|uniref:CPBP family intramembrane glutamic endopeptidase n=1 Tax=Bacillus sp. REN16 TaxID=2887296 RepID=UPI001E2C6F7D|nr:CPBP family intramembrane glutamic endopeptidase [Bacillus sp. REN16]MCC3355707.1 CPBP family intramembrane metalloprotease [Bacillus sp. REN16]
MTVFFIFWIAASIGSIAVMPYQFKMLKGKIEEEAKKNPTKKIPPTPVLVLLSILQSVILLGVSAFIGTWLAPKVDLHWWLLDRWLNGTAVPYNISGTILLSIVVGAIAAFVIFGLDILFMKKMPKVDIDEPSKFQAFIASFYGGISEEVLTRLFIMTAVVYVTNLLGLGNASYWIGILLAALLFGVGHLPAAFGLFGKTQIVVWRMIILNTIPGILFGYLFWKYGIEIAMVAHFTGDIFLHVIIGPFFRKKFAN